MIEIIIHIYKKHENSNKNINHSLHLVLILIVASLLLPIRCLKAVPLDIYSISQKKDDTTNSLELTVHGSGFKPNLKASLYGGGPYLLNSHTCEIESITKISEYPSVHKLIVCTKSARVLDSLTFIFKTGVYLNQNGNQNFQISY